MVCMFQRTLRTKFGEIDLPKSEIRASLAIHGPENRENCKTSSWISRENCTFGRWTHQRDHFFSLETKKWRTFFSSDTSEPFFSISLSLCHQSKKKIWCHWPVVKEILWYEYRFSKHGDFLLVQWTPFNAG